MLSTFNINQQITPLTKTILKNSEDNYPVVGLAMLLQGLVILMRMGSTTWQLEPRTRMKELGRFIFIMDQRVVYKIILKSFSEICLVRL